MIYVLFVLVLLIGLIALACGILIAQVIQQNGRMLLRIEAVEQYLSGGGRDPYDLDDYLDTLPAGVAAPPIELPDLTGTRRSLAEWRGQRLLLVFFDPECVFSRRLLPHLVAMDSDPVPSRPLPIIITTGSADANRALFDDAGFKNPVLVQTDTAVADAYKVDGTPMSYLVAADGSIASPVATGVQSTLILAGEMAAVTDAVQTEDGEVIPPRDARITRQGLSEGTTAPLFRLPRLGGGEISLLEYRGKDVVLVFSEPDCKPCETLGSRLEQAHREHSQLSLVVISRGDADENRGMAEVHGLTMPIGLQRHWEVSRQYDILSAPAAFHIDEWGVIAADVAVGPDAVLALIAKAAV